MVSQCRYANVYICTNLGLLTLSIGKSIYARYCTWNGCVLWNEFTISDLSCNLIWSNRDRSFIYESLQVYRLAGPIGCSMITILSLNYQIFSKAALITNKIFPKCIENRHFFAILEIMFKMYSSKHTIQHIFA